MIAIGQVIDGKYKILSEIGHGGMSVVYLALNERANKTWAIKEVRKDGGNDSEVVSQGLVAETEMLKKLNHPHLPSIVDVIDRDDSFIIVMDYIEGKSLQSVLKHEGAQSPENVIEWAEQLCDVLGYLHSRKPPIIYRDMKPGNVMLKPDGNVMLIDFGTAREYKAHSEGDTTWLGTRGYAAPEQFGGHGQTDARTDIYCLGATMYHLLTGYSPADTNFAVLPLGQLNPFFTGSGIEKIVSKCCEPDPANRYQNCAELMYALQHVHDSDDEVLRERKHKWTAFIGSIVVMAIGVAGMVGFSLARNNTVNSSYDYYVSQAKSSNSDFGTASDFYRKAIGLRPSSPDAYDELLSAIDNDMVFTQEENNSLVKCVLDTDGSTRKNLDYLESGNRKAYDNFVYRLANDYYFFYEGSDNRTKAAYWYDKVRKSTYLTEQEANLAESLYTIGNYYSSLGSEKNVYAVGDSGGNYLSFWNQMCDLTDGDLVAKTGGTRYAVALYKEMVNQIYTNASKFKSFGISKEDMQKQLDKVKNGMKDLSPEATAISDQISKTEDLIVMAQQMIDGTYK
ncbi:MAG TPA: serine/threonine-protein kinase [Lachnospiraceae bacterium]|nr:serine/threonine-protein kinase [Lachnospiraceae bacterium]